MLRVASVVVPRPCHPHREGAGDRVGPYIKVGVTTQVHVHLALCHVVGTQRIEQGLLLLGGADRERLVEKLVEGVQLFEAHPHLGIEQRRQASDHFVARAFEITMA